MRIFGTILFVLLCAVSSRGAGTRQSELPERRRQSGVRQPQLVAAIPLAGDLFLYDPKDAVPSPYVEASVLLNVRLTCSSPSLASPRSRTRPRATGRSTSSSRISPPRPRPRHSPRRHLRRFHYTDPGLRLQRFGRTSREALTGFPDEEDRRHPLYRSIRLRAARRGRRPARYLRSHQGRLRRGGHGSGSDTTLRGGLADRKPEGLRVRLLARHHRPHESRGRRALCSVFAGRSLQDLHRLRGR